MDNGQLVDAALGLILCIAAGTARFLVALYLVSAFQFKIIRGQLRNVFAMMLALPVALEFHERWPLGESSMPVLATMMLKEGLIGLVVGLTMALPYWLYSSVGAIIEQARGSNLTNIQGASEPDSSALGTLLAAAAFMVALESGGLALVVRPIYLSYAAIPLGQAGLTLPHVAETIAQMFGAMMTTAVVFSAPILAALLLVEAVFAFIGLSAPSLQVSFVSSSVKSLVALALLALTLPHLWPQPMSVNTVPGGTAGKDRPAAIVR